ncbi:hypothetical protein TWF696_006621 [Orbilia brochopaga]|uniref:Lytic polysaccharide monooxygenase n=1 Tax=Orbilia brochopaga TaxID=3140254 RepID=A0AAV9USQ8_9PEZI
MQKILALSAALTALQTVSAHASIKQPKPILFDEMRNNYNAPLKPDFSNYPCKGYHTQPFNAVEEWTAGQEATFTVDMSNIAAHGGGSCQASLSHDGGKTFQVIHSFIGDCPRAANGNTAGQDQVFKFKIPEDEPAGEAIFSWTWFAAIANREMYQDCAFVTIKGSNKAKRALTYRPNMFVGFLAPDACAIGEGTNLDFPDAGQYVTDGSANSDAQYKGKKKPSGSDCGNEASGGGETIQKVLPPNTGLGGSGSGGGGAVAGPKPAPANPPKVAKPAPAPTVAPAQPPASSGGPTIVYVTEVITNAIVDIVTVTETSYMAPAPTAQTHMRRDASGACQFQATMKIGNACSVPSVKSSTWQACVWRDFCSCLDDNLSPTDILNFSQVKGHCDCVTKGMGCPSASRSRNRKRHSHIARADMIMPPSEIQVAQIFKV